MAKHFISILICVFTFNILFAQSNPEIIQSEYAKYEKSEKEINNIYQRILKEYRSEPGLLKNLKAAQRLWIQFRYAEVKTKYPDETGASYGRVYSMCISIYLTQLTNERIKTLRVWLTGIEEEDVCAGSVKTKNK